MTIFVNNSFELYNEPDKLIINTSSTGYSYDTDFPKSDSRGRGKMKIFCYDWMLLESNFSKFHINFLVYDSEIFDSVDSQQTALNLELTCKKCQKYDVQYICTLNSDKIPKNHLSNFLTNYFNKLF